MNGKLASTIFSIEEVFTRILGAFITLVFAFIVILTILLVILRYVFNTGIIGGNELMEYLFVYITAIGSSIAISKNEHIRINFFVDKCSPVIKLIIDLLKTFLVAMVHMVFLLLSHSWISQVGHSESPVLRIPMRFIQLSVPICCVLSIFFCFLHGYRSTVEYRSEN